jgi:hypothetical protein
MSLEISKTTETGLQRATRGLFIARMDAEDATTQLTPIIDLICLKLGCGQLEDEEISIVINFILDKFKKLNMAEIVPAFDLAITRKLECDPNLYNKPFNCEYVGRVLDAYVKYRTPILKDMDAKMKKQEDHELREKSRETKNKIMKEETEGEINRIMEEKDYDKITEWHFVYINKNWNEFSEDELKDAIDFVFDAAKKEIARKYYANSKARKWALNNIRSHSTTQRMARKHLVKLWMQSTQHTE